MKKKKPISKTKHLISLAEAEEYLTSEQGQAELKAAFARAAAYIAQLRENARINPAMMTVPFGPWTSDGRWPARTISKEV
jgi:hypothetical protein